MHPSWSDRALVPVDDVTLCVQTVGDADDPPVLLIAGAAASMDWWDDAFCERLAAGGRLVHRYDHRDTGASTTFTPGDPPYDAGRLASDVLGLLDALGLDAAHLVGISMGGGIAQDIAVRHPDRVLSVALLSTSPAG
jgi:pimeloyl-ACP methyl ester carboxylesterase